MSASTSQILRRHDASLRGTLISRRIRSRALRVSKPYFVYEPPGLQSLRDVPLMYLLRGHQREWVNIREDNSRATTTAIEDLDRHIAAGLVPPVVAVIPGLNSSNNHVPSLGIDMVGRWGPHIRGLGTGRFWQYMTTELFPRIEDTYADRLGSDRYAVGFSLGGYTASLLALKMPGVFNHIAIYDGLFMWPANADPRVDGQHANSDPIWGHASIFDAAFGKPRKAGALAKWNPTDMLLRSNPGELATIRETSFYIASAPNDGQFGNVDRTKRFVSLLRERDVPTTYDGIVFDSDASHSWHWTDKFLVTFLSELFAARGLQAATR